MDFSGAEFFKFSIRWRSYSHGCGLPIAKTQFIDFLEACFSKSDNLTMLAPYTNGSDALSYIRDNPVDLMFVEINRPGVIGFRLVPSLPK